MSAMNLNAGLAGEARELAREYQSVLGRLPRTFLATHLIELQKWPALFDPEKIYLRELMKQLRSLSDTQFDDLFGSLLSFEAKTGCQGLEAANAEDFQKRALNHLQRQGQYSAWRAEIEKLFEKLRPLVEARVYSARTDPRLVVILYGEGIAIQRDKLWARFRKNSRRVPLDLGGAATSEAFLRALFTGRAEASNAAAAPTLFEVRRASGNVTPLDNWIIEAGDALHTLCEKDKSPAGACSTGMSFNRLRAYRERLTDSIYSKVLAGVRSPLDLADYLKTLQVKPQEGVTLYFDDVVLSFIRDTFLAGAGTLVINNTFVEWGAVQALKRAQPRLLVARFGVRDKLKPFSSLLLFSKPRATDQIPILEDPLGSFVDAEILAYYICLNAELAPPYRGRTLYLLLAEGVDEMLAVAPHAPGQSPAELATASLADVAVTMAHWLGVEMPGSPGRVLEPLVS